MSKTTEEIVTLADGLNKPYDIAIDEEYVYWVEQGTDGTDGSINKIRKR